MEIDGINLNNDLDDIQKETKYLDEYFKIGE